MPWDSIVAKDPIIEFTPFLLGLHFPRCIACKHFYQQISAIKWIYALKHLNGKIYAEKGIQNLSVKHLKQYFEKVGLTFRQQMT